MSSLTAVVLYGVTAFVVISFIVSRVFKEKPYMPDKVALHIVGVLEKTAKHSPYWSEEQVLVNTAEEVSIAYSREVMPSEILIAVQIVEKIRHSIKNGK